jgi:hypothetical protein
MRLGRKRGDVVGRYEDADIAAIARIFQAGRDHAPVEILYGL